MVALRAYQKAGPMVHSKVGPKDVLTADLKVRSTAGHLVCPMAVLTADQKV